MKAALEIKGQTNYLFAPESLYIYTSFCRSNSRYSQTIITFVLPTASFSNGRTYFKASSTLPFSTTLKIQCSTPPEPTIFLYSSWVRSCL